MGPPDFKLKERLLLPYLSAFWRIYAAIFYFSTQERLFAVVKLLPPMVDEYAVLPPVPNRCSLLLRGGLTMPWRSGVCPFPLPPIVFMFEPPAFFDYG